MIKHVHDNQLKKCIFFTLEDFEQMVNEMYHTGGIIAEVSYDGLSVYNGATCETYDIPELCDRLCHYFNVSDVESVHTDHCEMPGVWIVYEE